MSVDHLAYLLLGSGAVLTVVGLAGEIARRVRR